MTKISSQKDWITEAGKTHDPVFSHAGDKGDISVGREFKNKVMDFFVTIAETTGFFKKRTAHYRETQAKANYHVYMKAWKEVQDTYGQRVVKRTEQAMIDKGYAKVDPLAKKRFYEAGINRGNRIIRGRELKELMATARNVKTEVDKEFAEAHRLAMQKDTRPHVDFDEQEWVKDWEAFKRKYAVKPISPERIPDMNATRAKLKERASDLNTFNEFLHGTLNRTGDRVYTEKQLGDIYLRSIQAAYEGVEKSGRALTDSEVALLLDDAFNQSRIENYIDAATEKLNKVTKSPERFTRLLHTALERTQDELYFPEQLDDIYEKTSDGIREAVTKAKRELTDDEVLLLINDAFDQSRPAAAKKVTTDIVRKNSGTVSEFNTLLQQTLGRSQDSVYNDKQLADLRAVAEHEAGAAAEKNARPLTKSEVILLLSNAFDATRPQAHREISSALIEDKTQSVEDFNNFLHERMGRSVENLDSPEELQKVRYKSAKAAGALLEKTDRPLMETEIMLLLSDAFDEIIAERPRVVEETPAQTKVRKHVISKVEREVAAQQQSTVGGGSKDTPPPHLPENIPTPVAYNGVDYFDVRNPAVTRVPQALRNSMRVEQALNDKAFFASALPSGVRPEMLSPAQRNYIQAAAQHDIPEQLAKNPTKERMFELLAPIMNKAATSKDFELKILTLVANKTRLISAFSTQRDIGKLEADAVRKIDIKLSTTSYVARIAKKQSKEIGDKVEVTEDLLESLRPRMETAAKNLVRQNKRQLTASDIQRITTEALHHHLNA